MRKLNKWGSLLLLAAVCVMPSCRCRQPQIIVSNAILEIPHSVSLMADEANREKLAELVSSAVELEPGFYFDPKDRKGAVLKISIIPPMPTSKTVVLKAALMPQEEVKTSTSLSTYADIPLKDGGIKGEDIRIALTATLKDLLTLRQGLKPNNEFYLSKLEQALQSGDMASSEVIGAVHILGDTKETKATPLLVKILQSTQDLSLGNACIQALTNIDAKEAMPAIIEFAERKPPVIRRQAILAARKFATRLAAEWLLVMSLGYDDPITQKEASEALKEVEAKLVH